MGLDLLRPPPTQAKSHIGHFQFGGTKNGTHLQIVLGWGPTPFVQESSFVFFQRISILAVDFNNSLAVYLTTVPTLEISAMTNVHVVDKNTRFPGHGAYSSGSSGNSCVLGISAVPSTALECGEHA